MRVLYKPRPAFPQVRRADAPALEHTARQGMGRATLFKGCRVVRPTRTPGCVGNMLGRSPAINSRPLPPSQRRRPGGLPRRPGRSRPGRFATIDGPAGTHLLIGGVS